MQLHSMENTGKSWNPSARFPEDFFAGPSTMASKVIFKNRIQTKTTNKYLNELYIISWPPDLLRYDAAGIKSRIDIALQNVA